MANERRVIAPDINPKDSFPSAAERELNDTFGSKAYSSPKAIQETEAYKADKTALGGTTAKQGVSAFRDDEFDGNTVGFAELNGGKKDQKTTILDTYNEAVKAAPDVAKSMSDAAKSMAENDMEMHGGIVDVNAEIDDAQVEQVNVAAINGHGGVGVTNARIGKVKANIGIMSFTTNKGYDASKTSYNMANNIAAKKPALFGKKERVGIEGMSSEELEAKKAADVEDVMSK